MFNEKPTREEQSVASAQPLKSTSKLGTTAVIHTTKGDIVSIYLSFEPNAHETSSMSTAINLDFLSHRPFPPRSLQHFRLFPDSAPKAVENFCTHSKDGYYNGIIFHRIIKKFVSSSFRFLFSSRRSSPSTFFPFDSQHVSMTLLPSRADTVFFLFVRSDAPNRRSFGRRNGRREYLGQGVRGRVRFGTEAR